MFKGIRKIQTREKSIKEHCLIHLFPQGRRGPGPWLPDTAAEDYPSNRYGLRPDNCRQSGSRSLHPCVCQDRGRRAWGPACGKQDKKSCFLSIKVKPHLVQPWASFGLTFFSVQITVTLLCISRKGNRTLKYSHLLSAFLGFSLSHRSEQIVD